MLDLLNEILIKYHSFMMAHALNAESAKLHMNIMLLRIKARSSRQIKRMESKRGL